MCMIAVKEKGVVLPQKAHLRNGFDNNPHGTGIAILKNGSDKIIVKKDLQKFEKIWNYIEQNVTIDDILVVHFRWSTQGLKDNGNRHPFMLTTDMDKIRLVNFEADSIMAHNGVISAYSYYAEKTYSDTQLFVTKLYAEDFVQSNLDNPILQEMLGNILDGDRIVQLNKNSDIYYFGSWEDEEKVMYSNTNYKKVKTGTTTTKTTRMGGFSNAYMNSFGNDKDYLEEMPDTGYCDACNEYCDDLDKVHTSTSPHFLCKSCKSILNNYAWAERENVIEDIWDECSMCTISYPERELIDYPDGYIVCKHCSKKYGLDEYYKDVVDEAFND